MSTRRRKAEDTDVFAAMVRVMLRVGPAELTLGAIAAEAGVTAGALVQRFGSKDLRKTRDLVRPIDCAKLSFMLGRHSPWLSRSFHGP